LNHVNVFYKNKHLFKPEKKKNSVGIVRGVGHTYSISYSGDRSRRISSSRLARAKLVKLYLKKQKGWGCGSSDRALS
jgi:hypothetical protein